MCLVGDAVFPEGHREGAERRGLDGVDPDLEERLVHPGDEVRPGEDEHLVAAFEVVTAEIVAGETLLLHVRPERAVVNDDAVVDRVEIPASGHSGKCTAGIQPARSPFSHRLNRW